MGQTYYYAYNMQGDVVQILDSGSNVVVEYEYDPWGEIRNITGSMADTIGEENPFRYRGYYYDTESGLYYLNARYYDPVTHRFINSDITSYNLFAYCSNNSVNLLDATGEFAAVLIAGIDAILWFIAAMTTLATIATAPPVNISSFGWGSSASTRSVVLEEEAHLKQKALEREVKEKAKKQAEAKKEAIRTAQDKISRDSRTNYWYAEYNSLVGAVVVGKPVSFTAARKSLAQGSKQSFMARDWYYAYLLVAGLPYVTYEIDKGKEGLPGYYFHFHSGKDQWLPNGGVRHGDPHVWHYGGTLFPEEQYFTK